jgi:hypothetical protein
MRNVTTFDTKYICITVGYKEYKFDIPQNAYNNISGKIILELLNFLRLSLLFAAVFVKIAPQYLEIFHNCHGSFI